MSTVERECHFKETWQTCLLSRESVPLRKRGRHVYRRESVILRNVTDMSTVERERVTVNKRGRHVYCQERESLEVSMADMSTVERVSF